MGKRKYKPIMQAGREITSGEIEMIVETIEQFPKLSRNEIGATICELLEWFTASGTNKLDAGLKLLDKLEELGHVNLPKKRKSRKGPEKNKTVSKATDPDPEITGRVKDFPEIRIEPVLSSKAVKLWNEYVQRYHYLGYKKPFGFQMRYFIRNGKGYLGCALFAGAAKSMKRRDEWIGWTTETKMRNQAWLINNNRYLIFPWVHIKNLASFVLGGIERRIREDYRKKWGFEPVLMETFVDPQKYHGTCYKAANWEYLGLTRGTGLPRKGKTYSSTVKKIFVRPLVKNFRQVLCSENLVGRVL